MPLLHRHGSRHTAPGLRLQQGARLPVQRALIALERQHEAAPLVRKLATGSSDFSMGKSKPLAWNRPDIGEQ
jgi:hypothetical protein